jgi:nucleoside-diphosphate-sugar epimerase
MRVLVIGASRGTGAATVSAARRSGHIVTAFARSASTVDTDDGVRRVTGDVMDGEAVEKAVVGQDAVIVTLGIPDNPFLVRVTRGASSRLDVRSAGTARVIEAMRTQGVRRLVVQSTYGIGDGYRRLPLGLKAFFTLAIRPQVRDHELQEGLVRDSGLDWTIVRPVVLHDDPVTAPARIALDDEVPAMRVGRAQLADVHVAAVDRRDWVSHTLSVSE